MSDVDQIKCAGLLRLIKISGGRPNIKDVEILIFLVGISPVLNYPLNKELEKNGPGRPIREKSQYFVYSVIYKLITEGKIRILDLKKKRKLHDAIKNMLSINEGVIEKMSSNTYVVKKEFNETRLRLAKLFEEDS